MTAWRQENKGRGGAASKVAGKVASLVLLGALCAAVTLAGPVKAASTERVVTDHRTGLAISGFDPVAYFIQSRPVKGKADIEAHQGGAIWRFHDARDREIFLAAPEVYAPQFGGYDPTGLVRGRIIAGEPNLWLIRGGRLYLFSRIENRDAFAANAAAFAEAAEKWPALSESLADY
jgi:hypothetical protein